MRKVHSNRDLKDYYITTENICYIWDHSFYDIYLSNGKVIKNVSSYDFGKSDLKGFARITNYGSGGFCYLVNPKHIINAENNGIYVNVTFSNKKILKNLSTSDFERKIIQGMEKTL